MTDAERIERARRAQLALDEFLTPVFDIIGAEYLGRLKAITSREPWEAGKISSLANASRIVDEVRNQITALVLDGQEAQAKINRAKRVENMSASDRRLLGIGPF